MDTAINSMHDEEIMSIDFNRIDKVLIVMTNKSKLKFSGVDFFDFSPFEFQNVIFQINDYAITAVPEFIREEYVWIDRYLAVPGCRLFVIDSSVGMEGVILFMDYIKE